MASSSQPFALSLSLDSTLQPFLSPRHCSSPPSFSFPKQPLSPSSLHCTQNPQIQLAQNQPQTFLSPPSLTKKQILSDFAQSHCLSNGKLQIRRMLDSELDSVSNLLAESFIETLFFPENYAKLLAFLVKNYLLERRALEPHTTVLLGLYSEDEKEAELACTVEISFDARGANAASPTPVPPPECPYICNMTVKKSLRRRGIAKQLLKTCEELIAEMVDQRKVYLHCRMVDKVPQNLYKKAGFQIVKTDSFLVWLTLQRRKYLMCKELPEPLHHETHEDGTPFDAENTNAI
ncbi:hypothetical protein LUZ60_010051 [Juncus effusus]|nr:hypothetical protein LUZ60_010051 [Juncus effusus]